ncbi:MAG: SDR family NAD(P)-dependent oxidoreductase [Bacteroidales bacterium]
MRLKEKVAVVTGGARDLGRAVSVKLAQEGAKVVVNYFDNKEDADITVGQITSFGGKAIAVQGDMTKADDVKRLFAECITHFGKEVNILVNVVGGLVGRKPITEQDEAWYNFLMDVNMKSVFLCTREVVPLMTNGGSIINFSSQAARDGGGPGASMYATAKAAVMCHTRAMAKELGPLGIRVNALAPGMIATSFHDRFTNPAARENLEKTVPLRRQGAASDIADLVTYLASDESSYITGTNIDINGGALFS